MTILNPVAATVADTVKDPSKCLQRLGLNTLLLLWCEKLFVTKTVREIIFDGFHDPVLDNMPGLIAALPFIKDMIPEGALMDKFAFYYNRNGSDSTDGVWNMFTGINVLIICYLMYIVSK